MISTAQDVIDYWITGDVGRAMTAGKRISFDDRFDETLYIDNRSIAYSEYAHDKHSSTEVVYIAGHYLFASHDQHQKSREAAKRDGKYMLRQQALLRKRLDVFGKVYVSLPYKSVRSLPTVGFPYENATRYWRLLVDRVVYANYTTAFRKKIIADANTLARVFDMDVSSDLTIHDAADALVAIHVQDQLRTLKEVS